MDVKILKGEVGAVACDVLAERSSTFKSKKDGKEQGAAARRRAVHCVCAFEGTAARKASRKRGGAASVGVSKTVCLSDV